jgi:hypothetical protein
MTRFYCPFFRGKPTLDLNTLDKEGGFILNFKDTGSNMRLPFDSKKLRVPA